MQTKRPITCGTSVACCLIARNWCNTNPTLVCLSPVTGWCHVAARLMPSALPTKTGSNRMQDKLVFGQICNSHDSVALKTKPLHCTGSTSIVGSLLSVILLVVSLRACNCRIWPDRPEQSAGDERSLSTRWCVRLCLRPTVRRRPF